MKVEFERDEKQITGIDLIAENNEDKALLELLWRKDIKRKHLIARKNENIPGGVEVRLGVEVSRFDRKG